MTFKVKDAGGTLQTITSGKVQDGGTLRTLRTIKVMDATATLRTVASFATPFTSVSLPSEHSNTASTSTVTVNIVATPIGGLGPFTYSWVRLTGAATIASPTTASTAISASLVPGATSISTFRVTVTDSLGVARTADTTVSLDRLDSF